MLSLMPWPARRWVKHLWALGGDPHVPQLPSHGLLLGHQLPQDHAEGVDIDLCTQGL